MYVVKSRVVKTITCIIFIFFINTQCIFKTKIAKVTCTGTTPQSVQVVHSCTIDSTYVQVCVIQ